MTKKLVFFLYIGSNTPAEQAIQESKVLSLHFENLRRYAGVFDESVFVLSLKKELMGNNELIISWMTEVEKAGFLNVRFKIEENTQMRECQAFHDEVVESIDNTGKLVFFAHNKGTTNNFNESLLRLICSMYYFGLSFIDEVELFLNGMEHVYYGFPLLNAKWSGEAKAWEVIPIYRYYYYGTFFWTNVSLLREIMYNKKREYPVFMSRYYAENFPANTIELDMAGSHKNVYMLSGNDLHKNFDVSFNEYCQYAEDGETERKNFNAYCDDIKSKIGL